MITKYLYFSLSLFTRWLRPPFVVCCCSRSKQEAQQPHGRGVRVRGQGGQISLHSSGQVQAADAGAGYRGLGHADAPRRGPGRPADTAAADHVTDKGLLLKEYRRTQSTCICRHRGVPQPPLWGVNVRRGVGGVVIFHNKTPAAWRITISVRANSENWQIEIQSVLMNGVEPWFLTTIR